jgi:hypothetical protein
MRLGDPYFAWSRGDASAGELFETAVQALRVLESPYHLAIGLSDNTHYLAASRHRDEAERLSAEAQFIAEQLGARPLLARIATAASDGVGATAS